MERTLKVCMKYISGEFYGNKVRGQSFKPKLNRYNLLMPLFLVSLKRIRSRSEKELFLD